MKLRIIWRALVFAAYCIAQVADFVQTFKSWRDGDDDIAPDKEK